MNNLKECIVFEVCNPNKKRYIVSYILPSQRNDRFDGFLFSFEHVLCYIIARKPIFVLVTNDYNAGVGKFWRNVMATSKDTKIDLLVTTV